MEVLLRVYSFLILYVWQNHASILVLGPISVKKYFGPLQRKKQLLGSSEFVYGQPCAISYLL